MRVVSCGVVIIVGFVAVVGFVATHIILCYGYYWHCPCYCFFLYCRLLCLSFVTVITITRFVRWCYTDSTRHGAPGHRAPRRQLTAGVRTPLALRISSPRTLIPSCHLVLRDLASSFFLMASSLTSNLSFMSRSPSLRFYPRVTSTLISPLPFPSRQPSLQFNPHFTPALISPHPSLHLDLTLSCPHK